MGAVDFGEWALPDLELTMRGRTYTVCPPSVADGRVLLAAAARAEVNLGIVEGPVPAEVEKVLAGFEQGAHPALGVDVHQQMVDDGLSQVEIDRMTYYAVFYWARGREYADRLAALLWTPRTLSQPEDDAAPKG